MKITVVNNSLKYTLNEDNEFRCDHDDGAALELITDSFDHEFGTQNVYTAECGLGCDDVTHEQALMFIEG